MLAKLSIIAKILNTNFKLGYHSAFHGMESVGSEW
jgi:hypothetical protein